MQYPQHSRQLVPSPPPQPPPPDGAVAAAAAAAKSPATAALRLLPNPILLGFISHTLSVKLM